MYHEEDGFAISPVGSLVCSRHFTDTFFQSYIEDNGEIAYCDYCDDFLELEPKRECLPIDSISKIILDGILLDYDLAINHLPYDSSEGGWQWKFYDTYNLLIEEFEWELDVDHEVFQDIYESLPNEDWCEKNPFGYNDNEYLYYSWDYFCRVIKYKIRYLFYEFSDESTNNEFYSKPHLILENIGELVNKFKLIYQTDRSPNLFPFTSFFRARQHNKITSVDSYQELGPPKIDRTISSRMSPIGIPMFYGTLEKKTAIMEIIDKTMKDKPIISVGEFEIIKSLCLIDLTNLPKIPSLFDPKRRTNRSSLIFLHQFVRDLNKEVIYNGSEQLELVPTQVVTEFFRHVYPRKYKTTIDGILYKSAKDKEKTCCVLFIENKNCTQNSIKEDMNNKVLSLKIESIESFFDLSLFI